MPESISIVPTSQLPPTTEDGVKYGWVTLTQEEFDALEDPDPNVLYMISN